MFFSVILFLAAKVVVAEKLFCPHPCVCPNVTDAICSNGFLQGMNEEFDFNLQNLDFSGNMILALDDTTLSSWGVENLKTLNISNNMITEITEYAFLGLNRLRFLDLSRNNITTIHPDTFCFNDLIFLSLAKNQISKMPLLTFWNEEIALTILDLSDNELIDLQPNTFSNFMNLETLLLANNNISSLPSRIFEFNRKLILLDLQGNSLTSIESNTFQTQLNLRTLILSDNQLLDLKPKVFSGCTNLLNLSISGNVITSIHSDAFQGLTNLQRLDLSRNKLRNINYQAFQFLSPLVFLNDSSVPSTDSRIHVYKVSNLKYVNLSRNKIQSLNLQNCFPIVSATNASTVFKNLEVLDLSRNKLNSLDDMTVAWLNSSHVIPNFSFNPWKCECGIYDDSIKLLMKKITLMCESPYKYLGRNWSVLIGCPPRPKLTTTTTQRTTTAAETKMVIISDHFYSQEQNMSVKVRSKGDYSVTVSHLRDNVVETTSTDNKLQNECKTLKTSIAVFFLACILIIVALVAGKRLCKKRKYEAVAAFTTPSQEDSSDKTTDVNTISSTDYKV
ncbi:hypothetical protein C0J52_18790 [Blattella germanica]|nr:hypothetical protein C0J52_18790 [Blattella germanica]